MIQMSVTTEIQPVVAVITTKVIYKSDDNANKTTNVTPRLGRQCHRVYLFAPARLRVMNNHIRSRCEYTRLYKPSALYLYQLLDTA